MSTPETENCAICYNALTAEHKILLLPCGHDQFHLRCIAPWMVRCDTLPVRGLTCPMCRSRVECITRAASTYGADVLPLLREVLRPGPLSRESLRREIAAVVRRYLPLLVESQRHTIEYLLNRAMVPPVSLYMDSLKYEQRLIYPLQSPSVSSNGGDNYSLFADDSEPRRPRTPPARVVGIGLIPDEVVESILGRPRSPPSPRVVYRARNDSLVGEDVDDLADTAHEDGWSIAAEYGTEAESHDD
ncbi:hypothetical protein EDC01DRAFT_762839 [Geopyxis carbonaria]|nr:hypothetical protein EDC01DRAFT_762839 [Geopyxis carbonaria]